MFVNVSPSLKDADKTVLPRLVGFYEYVRAVDLLEELVRSSTPEEIRVYNEIVAKHPELAIYTNLSRLVEPKGSSLAEQSVAKDEDFKRTGLDWMIALAKVELGAMLASYTDSPAPFAAVKPLKFEQAAYAELLLDGARYHYWSLTKDPLFLQIVTRSEFKPTSETVAYVRRLSLSTLFLVAAIDFRKNNWASDQIREATKWKSDLDSSRNAIEQNIRKYMAQTISVPVGSSTNTTSRERSFAGLTTEYQGQLPPNVVSICKQLSNNVFGCQLNFRK